MVMRARSDVMGIAERREREKEEVRRKILDAAQELFASEGYERVTMRRIAEAIEYSPTTIYNHFEDKDELCYALCEEDFKRLLSAIAEHPAPQDPVEWIRQLGRAYAAFGRENPNHYRFMFMTPAKFEQPHEAALPAQEAFGFLRVAVARAIEQGRFTPGNPDTMAQVLWSGLHGAVALLITLTPELWPQVPAAPDLVEHVIEHGIRGYLKETR
jgi:AcrR family transcriptional regulator